MDTDLLMKMAFSLVGGLGIFLLGMRYMSEGLQTITGPSLRRMIGAVTDNRIAAVITGLLVTCFVQSSSVSTVMAIGFVNSGIMALHQAMGVILGANIGTTITGWVLALKIGKYGLPILGVCAFIYLFSKRERTRYIALAIMGVGMIFFGLELMKNGFKPMKSLPEFQAWFNTFHANSYFGVLKCVAVGCILTFIVQSSSATLGITIALATQGLLDFQTAGALVLGENIGTTITAMLASIGAAANARRAAYFHMLFNVVGVFVMTIIFIPIYIPGIEWLLAKFSGIPDVMAFKVDEMGVKEYTSITIGIATVHSVFNIANVIIFLPFVRVIARFLERIVPDSPGSDKHYLTGLDFADFETGWAAIERSKFEIDRMGVRTQEMMDNLKAVLEDVDDDVAASKIFERENILDNVQKEITAFITDVRGDVLSHELIEESSAHLVLADEYESVSDYITQILKLCIRLREDGLGFLGYQMVEMKSLNDRLNSLFKKIISADDEAVSVVSVTAETEGEAIKKEIRKYRTNHWSQVSEQKMNPLLITSYSDVLVSYRKINDHLVHIASARSGVL